MKPVYPIMVTCDNQPAMVTAPNAGMPMGGKTEAVDGGPGSGPRPGGGKSSAVPSLSNFLKKHASGPSEPDTALGQLVRAGLPLGKMHQLNSKGEYRDENGEQHGKALSDFLKKHGSSKKVVRDGGPGSGPRPGGGKEVPGAGSLSVAKTLAKQASQAASAASKQASSKDGFAAAAKAHEAAAKAHAATGNYAQAAYHQDNANFSRQQGTYAAAPKTAQGQWDARVNPQPKPEAEAQSAAANKKSEDEAPTWQGRDLDSANPDAPADHGMDAPGCGAWPGRVE